MATGDLNGNLQRLLRELKAIKFPTEIDDVGLRLGDPVAFLPLLNFALLKFSRHVARFIIRNGFELAGKTDHRFIESSFRLFRDVLNVRTVLTPAQFFEQGFAERKVLLLCDVIAVCKKLHNEEVRQERLAALKANRQEHVSNRLTAPRRGSPSVKVVRHDDIEVTTFLAPQHLPNPSDGSQSVFKTKKTTVVTRSPSPSPSTLGPAGPPPRSRSSPSVQRVTGKGEGLELTFRPAAQVQPDLAPQPVLGPQKLGAQASAPPPIRYWFMNPAFDGNEDGVAEIGAGTGLDLGTEGRPDSSAWWLPSSSPPGHPASTFWQQGAFANASYSDGQAPVPNAAPAPAAAGSGSSPGTQTDGHLFLGVQAPSLAPLHGTAAVQRQQGYQARAWAQDRVAILPPQRDPGTASAAVFPAAVTAAAGSRAASGGGARTTRDLDEWSFSRFFGPGKVAPASRTAGDATDEADSNHELAGLDGEGVPAEQPVAFEAAALDGAPRNGADRALSDLERDGPALDQDRRHGAGPLGSVRPARALGPPAWSTAAARADGQLHGSGQPMPATLRDGNDSSGTGASANATDAANWVARLAQLERETQEQLQALQGKLGAAEAELEKTRVEAKQSRDVLQARVTVLEGRVRFLECELELCIKRQPGQGPVSLSSPQRTSPQGGLSLQREPSLGPPGPPLAATAISAMASEAAVQPTSPSSRYSPRHPAVVNPQPTERVQGVAASSFASRSRIAQSHSQAPHATHVVSAATVGDSYAGPAGAAGTGLTSARHPSGIPPSFSPMPQPTFSFQPTRLMQQVASATSGSAPQTVSGPSARPAPATLGQGSSTSVYGARSYGSSLDSASAALRPAPHAALPGQAGVNVNGTSSSSAATMSTRLSLDSAVQSTAPAATGLVIDGHPGASAGSAVASGGHAPAWRAVDRPGPMNGGPQGRSILDTVAGTEAGQPSGPPMRRDAASLAVPPASEQHMGFIADGGSGGPRTATRATTADAAGPGPMTGYPLPPSADGGSTGTNGTFRSTDDLINSLYVRYTEAQDFLQTLRKR